MHTFQCQISFWLFCLCFLVFFHCSECSNRRRHSKRLNSTLPAEAEEKEFSIAYQLHHHLLNNYRASVRPIRHPKDSLRVAIYVALYQLIKIDPVKNTVTMSGSFELYWQDEYLQWNPNEYGGTKEVFLGSKEVWTPEISLYYSHHHKEGVVLRTNNDIRLNYTGHLRYYIPFTTESICPVDVQLFPFDKQKCTLFFGSWAHSNESLNLKLWSGKLDLNDFYDNQEWRIQEANSSIREEDWPYDYLGTRQWWSVLILTVSVQRQSFYYVFNLVIPSTIITIVSVIGFHMPSNSGRLRDAKFRVGIIALMSMSVILLAVVEDMPKFSIYSIPGKRDSFSGVPLIGLYYFSLLVIIGLSTTTTSLFVLLERNLRVQKTVPFYMRWLAFGHAALYKGYNRSEISGLEIQTQTPRTELRKKLSIGQYDNLIIFNYFHQILEELISAIGRIERSLAGVRHELLSLLPQDEWDTQWVTIIRRLELISLAIYLIAICIALLLFFFHDWYLK